MPFRPIAMRQNIIIFSILFKEGDLLVVARPPKGAERCFNAYHVYFI